MFCEFFKSSVGVLSSANGEGFEAIKGSFNSLKEKGSTVFNGNKDTLVAMGPLVGGAVAFSSFLVLRVLKHPSLILSLVASGFVIGAISSVKFLAVTSVFKPHKS